MEMRCQVNKINITSKRLNSKNDKVQERRYRKVITPITLKSTIENVILKVDDVQLGYIICNKSLGFYSERLKRQQTFIRTFRCSDRIIFCISISIFIIIFLYKYIFYFFFLVRYIKYSKPTNINSNALIPGLTLNDIAKLTNEFVIF